MKTLSMLVDSLKVWESCEPEHCQRIAPDAYRVTTDAMTFDVALNDEPSNSTLEAIELAIATAAQRRGWVSTVEAETVVTDLLLNYVAKIKLGSIIVERECSERAIARLQSYLAASRGKYDEA